MIVRARRSSTSAPMIADQVIHNADGSETVRRRDRAAQLRDRDRPLALALQGPRPLRAAPGLRPEAGTTGLQGRLLHARQALHPGPLRQRQADRALRRRRAWARVRGPLPGLPRGPEHRGHGREGRRLLPRPPGERGLVAVREQPLEQRGRHQDPPLAERVRRGPLRQRARGHRAVPARKLQRAPADCPLDRKAPRMRVRIPRGQHVGRSRAVVADVRCSERCSVAASARLRAAGRSSASGPSRRRGRRESGSAFASPAGPPARRSAGGPAPAARGGPGDPPRRDAVGNRSRKKSVSAMLRP